MSVSATYSKHKLGNYRIAVIALVALSIWCAYDGYYNQDFIEKHTTEEGKADDTLIFCQKFPFLGIPAALAAGGAFFYFRKKELTADEQALVLSSGKQIDYDKIQEIDHTDFEKKGKFQIKYAENESEKFITLSDKKWDNLNGILEHLISKIS